MRYVSMQLLTWGTIAGAVVSALWLAASDVRPDGALGATSLTAAMSLLLEPPGSGRSAVPAAPRQGGSPPGAGAGVEARRERAK